MKLINQIIYYDTINISKMKKIIPILGIFLLSLNALLAQHQNVIIGHNIVSAVPTEPSITINPQNPDEILVGAMSDNYYQSVDGGYSWTHGILQSAWGVQADPCVLVDNSGRFYYLHLPNVIERVVCHRKESISDPWTLETSASYNGTHEVDKEWV